MTRIFSSRGVRLGLSLAMLIGLGGAGSARGLADMDPKAITVVFPNDIKWTKTATSERAVLYGDPSKPGYYVILLKWLPHNNSRPHYHPNDRFITVLSRDVVGTDRRQVRSGRIQADSRRQLRRAHGEGNSLRRREGRAVPAADLRHGSGDVSAGGTKMKKARVKAQTLNFRLSA